MIDPELRLIAGLLHASVNDQQEFYLRQIPTDLYSIHKPEMNWVARYRENHHKFPSPQAFQAKFNVKLKRPKDPLPGLLEAVLERVQYNHLKTNVQRTRELLDAKAPMVSVVKQYQEDAAALRTYSVRSNIVDRSQSRGAEAYYRERYLQNQDPNSNRITSPWPSLNKLCPTFAPKDVAYLYARLSMGKTWLAQRWANFLARRGIRSLIASYEMSLSMMELRDEAIRCGISFPRLLEGKLTPKELFVWRKRKRLIRKKPYDLFMMEPDNAENGFAAVEEEIYRIQPQVVFLDALYLASHPSVSRITSDPSKAGRRAELTKELARKTNTFVVGILQANRENEDKKGKTTTGIKNIYGSDQWAQSGDYAFEITGQRGSVRRRVSVTKGRNSAVGDFMIDFDMDCPTFDENHLNVLEIEEDAPTHTFTK